MEVFMVSIEQLGTKVENLEAKIEEMETKLREVEDVKEIEKLQRIYGYYLDNRLHEDVVNLFSDDTESVDSQIAGMGQNWNL